jgi:hypothetical protein
MTPNSLTPFRDQQEFTYSCLLYSLNPERRSHLLSLFTSLHLITNQHLQLLRLRGISQPTNNSQFTHQFVGQRCDREQAQSGFQD